MPDRPAGSSRSHITDAAWARLQPIVDDLVRQYGVRPLARLLGCSRQRVYMWRRGECRPSLGMALRIDAVHAGEEPPEGFPFDGPSLR